MSSRASRCGVGVVALAVACATASGQRAAREWFTLKNGMNSPMTVLIQAKQQSSPAQYRILRGDTFKYSLEHDGPHTIQVIPDDQKDSGYHLGAHDLRVLGRALAGQPLELKGDFRKYIDLTTGVLYENRKDRVTAYFDVFSPSLGGPVRLQSPRNEYMRALADEDPDMIEEPVPEATFASITVIVPRNARVTIAGDETAAKGKCRYFSSTALTPGKTYQYEIRVDWKKDGHNCSVTRRVPIRAGEVTRAYFTLPIAPPPEPK